MPQYLLNIIQPVGEVPPPEDLEPVMRELAALNEEMRAAGAWVFAAALHQPETYDRRPCRRRRRAHHRRPLRGGQGVHRRLRPDPGRGPRRRPRLGRQARARPRWPARRGPARSSAERMSDGRRIERVFRENYGRAVAVLIRLLGDIDAAEEAVQDAFLTAVQRWPADGIPPSPAGLDRHDRPQPGHRPAAPRGRPRPTGTPRPRCCDADDRARGGGRRAATTGSG